MSHSSHSQEAHSPHWTGKNRDEWIKVIDRDTVRISARAMDVVWGNDARFWQWINLPKEESCFEVGVNLIQVNWIEVTGSLDLARFELSPHVAYEIFYVVKFPVDAFGWHSSPITFEVTAPDGSSIRRSELLEPYRNKGDGWQEIRGGEFRMPSNLTGKVRFGMREVKTDWWKGGMILEGATIRPKRP